MNGNLQALTFSGEHPCPKPQLHHPSPADHCSPVSEPCSLPSTLSGLLQAAITDARSLEHSSSLIASRLRNPPTTNVDPDQFSYDTGCKLHAIDSIRRGDWHDAFSYVYALQPAGDLSARLDALPKPRQIDFYDWACFERHLQSLEQIIPSIDEIDEIATASS